MVCALVGFATAVPQIYLHDYNGSLALNAHMNGTNGATLFVDETGKNISVFGDSKTVTAVKALGNASGYFDGSNDYLSTFGGALGFGTGDFTILAHVNRSSSATGYKRIITSGDGTSFIFRYQVTEQNYFCSILGTPVFEDGIVLPANTFHQLVLSRNGTSVKLYDNGTLIASGVSADNITFSSTNPFLISGNSTMSWHGNIDEVGVWGGVAIPIENLYPQTLEIGTEIPPIAIFTADPMNGTAPLNVQFTEISASSGTSWIWRATNVVGNNTPFTFNTTSGSPIHPFVDGNYSISLTSTNAGGSNTSTQITFVNVTGPPLTPDFSSFNTAGGAPFTTYFYDQSINASENAFYFWDFGDGNTSTQKNLYYTYNMTGTYPVNHSVSNSTTIVWKNQSDYITVSTPTPPVVAPVASFYGGPQLGPVPLKVFFTDVSSNTPTSWNWSLGDGTFNETQNPMHVYTRSGFFMVNLTATNSAGSNTTSQTNFVMVY